MSASEIIVSQDGQPVGVLGGRATKGIIEPTPEARADFKRVPFVRERFQLRPASVERLRSTPWSFGFGSFSEVVYRDNNYCRKRPDGRLEEWPETIERVVNGVMSIRKDHYIKQRLHWDEGKWQELAEEMALSFLRLECGPPGRGYSMMGTNYVYERGSFALTNCFDGAETFITKEYGVTSFASVVGQSVSLLTKDGWAPGTISCFGEQEVVRVTFAPTRRQGGGGGTKHRVVVVATPNHRWIMADGRETTTLKAGDFVQSQRNCDEEETQEWLSGFRHGFVFADGSAGYRYINGERSFILRLCGKKSRLVGRFEHATYAPGDNGDPVVYVRSGKDLKSPPLDSDATPDYVRGFMDGWCAGDGSITKSGNVALGSQDAAAMEWVKSHAAIGGYFMTGISTDSVMETNFGRRSAPMQRALLSKDSAGTIWRVVSVEPLDMKIQVYCATVPGQASFALASGVYTGNCAATTIQATTFDRDLGWAMDALLCGSGVGFECLADPALKLEIPFGGARTYSVPDTKEGWSQSTEILLGSYMGKYGPVEFSYDEIRAEGTPINGFGGVCPGPEPLRKLHARMRDRLDRFCRGEISSLLLKADLANQIGDCVVSGGVRRSAEILIGDPEDREFLDLKDYSKHPERDPDRGGWGHLSNNSPRLTKREHFNLIPTEIAPRARINGEPGLLNMIAIQRFARFGREKADPATLIQPCQPAWATLLTPDGIRTMGEISVGDTIWSGQRWTKVVRKVPTGVKSVLAYKTRAGTFYGTENHRVIQDGEKVEVKDAETIDIAFCRAREFSNDLDPRDVLDGIVLGDGSVHKASNDLVYLLVGKDDSDYFKSEISRLFIEDRSVSFCASKSGSAWVVDTTIRSVELPKTYERVVPDRFVAGNTKKVRGFLRGLFTANGSVVADGGRVTLKAASFSIVEAVQAMLSSLGIRSYHSVNKAHDVEFANGTYTCRESYDVNICLLDDRRRFLDLIGFIQSYKVEKLSGRLAQVHRLTRRTKESYEIQSVEPLGEENVYDITVEADEHTYWTGGLLVSNCGELPLVDKEICTLSENYPSRAPSERAIVRNAEMTCFYTSTVALLPTHRPETNRVVARHRRIGVGMSGIADWEARASVADITRVLRRAYLAVISENEHLAAEAGVPASIRCTTVKPSGTVSLLAGVSPGGHFAMGEFYIRRKRVSTLSPFRAIFNAAGIPCEKAEGDNTLVYEFPQAQAGVRTQAQAGVFEQALQLCMLQREWSDNAVSFTLDFDPKTEGPQIANLLAQIAPMVKSVSVLPRGTYAQAPYEEISEREFKLRSRMVRPIDWSGFTQEGSGEADKYCNAGKCEVPQKPAIPAS